MTYATTGGAATRFINDGSDRPPRLAVYGNEWALGELPRRPSAVTWSFEECLDRLVQAGYDGCQAATKHAGAILSRGLRFCAAGRVNAPGEADAIARDAAAAGADCVTLHVGWGMETDAEADALVDAVLTAGDRHGVPSYIETHRATLAQDVSRINGLLDRHQRLRLNGDYSHLYCGQEMTYRGFATTRGYLDAIVARTAFIHARISDGECMQCDILDPINARHVANFTALWRDAMRGWLTTAGPGDVFAFTPELGPFSSGYSIRTRDAGGQLVEACDRWAQSLELMRIGRAACAAAVADAC